MRQADQVASAIAALFTSHEIPPAIAADVLQAYRRTRLAACRRTLLCDCRGPAGCLLRRTAGQLSQRL